MKRFIAISAIACILFFSACSGDSKKVIVWASGQVTISGNTITLEPGNRHTEVQVPVSGDKITFKSPDGDAEFPVAETGVYILNLKKDTVVGSYQRVGTGEGEKKISREQLKQRIDSLNQLMAGTNVNAAAKNFNIPPRQIAKITSNSNAQIIGPFLKMPSTFEGGKDHEIYKFYTNKEIIEIVDRLRPMAEEQKAEEN
jgi:hypothetical protein